MKNTLTILLLWATLCSFTMSKPKLYKIQYIGTNIVAYSDIRPSYDGRKDILIYEYKNGKYRKM
jgi:hypothetical protein